MGQPWAAKSSAELGGCWTRSPVLVQQWEENMMSIGSPDPTLNFWAQSLPPGASFWIISERPASLHRGWGPWASHSGLFFHMLCQVCPLKQLLFFPLFSQNQPLFPHSLLSGFQEANSPSAKSSCLKLLPRDWVLKRILRRPSFLSKLGLAENLRPEAVSPITSQGL